MAARALRVIVVWCRYAYVNFAYLGPPLCTPNCVITNHFGKSTVRGLVTPHVSDAGMVTPKSGPLPPWQPTSLPQYLNLDADVNVIVAAEVLQSGATVFFDAGVFSHTYTAAPSWSPLPFNTSALKGSARLRPGGLA